MLSLTVSNIRRNQSLRLTQSMDYQLVAITGLEPPPASISMSEYATMDGSQYNSARIPKRNIVLTIQPLGYVEKKRTALYNFFVPKERVILHIKTDTRDVTIDGDVETVTIDYNANPQLVQVSIICTHPYFYDKHYEYYHMAEYDTLTVINNGDISVWFDVRMIVQRASDYFQLYNNVDMEFLTFRRNFAVNDMVYIDTRPGHRYATLARGNTITSLFPYLEIRPNMTWPMLYVGEENGIICTGAGTLNFLKEYAGL